MGKSTISMAISNSYVSLPEGIYIYVYIGARLIYLLQICAFQLWIFEPEAESSPWSIDSVLWPALKVNASGSIGWGPGLKSTTSGFWESCAIDNPQQVSKDGSASFFTAISHVTSFCWRSGDEDLSGLPTQLLEHLGLQCIETSKLGTWWPSITPSELQCEAPKIAKLVYK